MFDNNDSLFGIDMDLDGKTDFFDDMLYINMIESNKNRSSSSSFDFTDDLDLDNIDDLDDFDIFDDDVDWI